MKVNNQSDIAKHKPSESEVAKLEQSDAQKREVKKLVLLPDLLYKAQIPSHLVGFIKDIFEPEPDGNCDFQCVAKAVGYNKDGWFQVRKEMVKEILAKKDLYSKLQVKGKIINKIVAGLNMKTLKTKAGRTKWFEKLSHGQVLSNAIIRPVFFVLLPTCDPYLPLRLGPDNSQDPDPIYMLHVNKNHWFLVNI
ncbi:hypothetical protein PTTG_07393, partial [Puccinia triticina 1-1 BBBD Race 1]